MNLRKLHILAILLGAGLAFLVSSGGGPLAIWERIAGPLSRTARPGVSPAAISDHDLDRQKPQKQAEILLERAVNHSAGATTQIESRVDRWRGKIKWDAQLGGLTTAALNSNDSDVRASAVEVQLAAYGVDKNDSSVDRLIQQARSGDHAQKIWALWTLGLMGNRGVETERVVRVLSDHLGVSGNEERNSETDGDDDEDSRRWAVEGLALVGTTPTIAPLLGAMHNDRSPLVRERAACSLAESGMLSHEQRTIAIPELINYSGDPALDQQTRGWAFQALGDITKKRLPNDTAAWREWYASSGNQ